MRGDLRERIILMRSCVGFDEILGRFFRVTANDL